MAIHAFHCTDSDCERPQCSGAKLILLKIQEHAQRPDCAVRELLGIDAECKLCKLWGALHNSCAPSAVELASASELPQDDPPESPHEAQLPQGVSERLRLETRQRLRELPPGLVKRMLITHVRHCRNRWRCGTCRKVRERLAANRLALSQQPPQAAAP